MGTFPIFEAEGLLAVTQKILEKRMAKKCNRVVVYGLFQWSKGLVEDATWEELSDIHIIFLSFNWTLEVKGLLKEGQLL